MSETVPTVAVTRQKDISIVEFTQHKILDELSIQDVERALNSLIDEVERPKLLLDFGNVDHLSSAALGMLIEANDRIRKRNGQLRLSNIKPQIFEVFVLTQLNKLFRISPTRAEALGTFTQG